MNKLVFASVISEIQQSEIFMTVKARICEAPAANLNGARVTEAFIDEIVSNENRYVGLPLYADVRALANGNYRRLGHLYDAKTGEFHSTQIGSFYQFEKETFDGGCALIGYARIAKRNKKVSKAISELFTDGALKFSFEVAVGEYEELDDNTILIDASDSNYLEGTAIVTFPACEDAVALELVAQKTDEGGEKEMADKIEIAAEETKEGIAKETKEEVAEESKEESKETSTEEPEEEAASCKKEKAEENETAAVVIREENSTSTHAYDTENGTEVHQSVYTEVTHVEEDAQIVEATDGVHVAEGESTDAPAETPTETPVETPTETPAEPAAETGDNSGESGEDTAETPAENLESAADIPVIEEKHKTAEELIAELAEQIASLQNEIAELKAQKVVAEVVTAEVNPFVEPINAEKRYGLLEKVETGSTSYSLLSRA